ncbi:MAG TPA: hypothetical protein VG795_00210 [Acidimicrobiia bacterium]|nr:hypothetical protein [Acidimicrobiia bacterium]
MGGQVVDTQSASEFMRETLEKVSRDELLSVAALLDAKAAGFAALLGSPGQARKLPREDLRRVLRSIFATRRKADAILDDVGPDRLGAAIDDLLHGEGLVPERFNAFDAVLAAYPEQGFDLPSELLHFTAPDRWWLWTRWMWDPRAGTGSLALVTTEDFDLDAPDRGEGYLRVGEAMAFVNETGKAVGFTDIGSGLFGADVFLACVYSVYMYTVLRLRMTQEFNRIVPELPDLVRRLLGVYRPEV